jgi:ABC-2 type transport system permease protein
VRGLLRSEVLKLTSTPVPLALLAAAVGYVVINVVALVFAAGQQGVPGLDVASSVRNVYASAGAASPIVLVAGILGMTTEYRFMTVTPTFLATPRRGRVLTAKLLVHAAFGLVIGVVCVLVSVALAAGLLSFKPHAAVGAATVLQISLGTLLGYALYAVLGVSVGALVRNQIAAILGGLLWALVIEALIVAFLPRVGEWLPGGALHATLQATSFTGGHYLAPWAGTLVLLGYAALFALIAARTTLRRDVT